MVRAVIIAALVGVIGGELLLDVVFPMPAAATEGFDRDTWKPCAGRKPVRSNGHKYVWYCGPKEAATDRERAVFVDESAKKRGTAPRSDRGREASKGSR